LDIQCPTREAGRVGSSIQNQAVKKRGYLRQLVEGAKRSSSSVKETLLAAQGAVFLPSFKLGRIVVSNSGAGQSGSFQMAGGGNDWTQDNIFGLLEEFLMLLDSLDATLYPDDADPSHSDSIFQALCGDDSLNGVQSQMGDWTALNIPSIGGAPSA
jgi:hypothetical protein